MFSGEDGQGLLVSPGIVGREGDLRIAAHTIGSLELPLIRFILSALTWTQFWFFFLLFVPKTEDLPTPRQASLSFHMLIYIPWFVACFSKGEPVPFTCSRGLRRQNGTLEFHHSGGDQLERPPSFLWARTTTVCSFEMLAIWGLGEGDLTNAAATRPAPPPPPPVASVPWTSTFTIIPIAEDQIFPFFFHWSNHFIFFYTYEWKCTMIPRNNRFFL